VVGAAGAAPQPDRVVRYDVTIGPNLWNPTDYFGDGRAHQRPYAGNSAIPPGTPASSESPGTVKYGLPHARLQPMAERSRTRRNTLERRCLPKTFKRMFVGAPKGIFKMLEKIKKN
jgi:hypothetical protein